MNTIELPSIPFRVSPGQAAEFYVKQGYAAKTLTTLLVDMHKVNEAAARQAVHRLRLAGKLPRVRKARQSQ